SKKGTAMGKVVLGMEVKTTKQGIVLPPSRWTELCLKPGDSQLHAAVTGMSGVGKSVFCACTYFQQFANGEAVSFIDPHSDACKLVVSYLIQHRYYNSNPIAFEKLRYIEWNAKRSAPAFNILAPTKTTREPVEIAQNALQAMQRAYPET